MSDAGPTTSPAEPPAGDTIDARARELLALLPDAVAICDPDGSIRYRFPWATPDALRVAPHERTQPLLSLVHPDDRDRALALLRAVCAGEQPGAELQVRTRTPRLGWSVVHVRLHGFLDHPDVRGVVVCVSSTTRDDREERLRALWLRSPVALFETDLDGYCTMVNPAWCELSQLGADESLGHGWLAAIHPDDRDDLLAEWERCVAARAPFEREYRLVRPDGGVRWMHGRAAPLLGPDGEPTGYIGSLQDVTAARGAHDFLVASAERLHTILAASSDLVVVLDARGRFTYVSPSAKTLLGHDPEEWLGMAATSVVHPDDVPAATEAFAQTRAAPGEAAPLEVRIADAGGRFRHFQVIANNLLHDPVVAGIVVSARDLSAIQSADERAAAAEERFARLFDQASTGMATITGDGTIVRANHALESLLGVPLDHLTGSNLLRYVDRAERPECERNLRGFADGTMQSYRADRTFRRGDGVVVHARVVATAMRDRDGGLTEILVQIEDETERRELARRLAHDATHDRLTGLANRALLLESIDRAVAAARRSGRQLAVLFIDLDNFKPVNDTLGHDAGDELLRGVAARLREHVRGGDQVARLGGDEFAVLCADLAVADDAVDIAHRLKAALHEPFDVRGREVSVGACIGVAIAGSEPVEAAGLVARADAAAYRGKHNGRGRVEVYDRDLEYQLERRNVVRAAVLRLASTAEAPLVGQPILGLADGVTIGYQVEVDWRALGVEPAEAFALLAEDSHSARAAGLAMLEAGIAAVARWAAAPGERSLGIGLRFPSRYVLDPDFVPCLRDAIGRRSVPPSLVWVGIPADAFTHDREHATWTAKALAGLGHGVALDGFGFAASLGELRAAGAHTVVLAPDLHDGIADDRDAYTLCRGVVALARDLGLVTVAREVRDERVLARLTEIGCQFAVGDVFGPPLPTTELAPGAVAQIGS